MNLRFPYIVDWDKTDFVVGDGGKENLCQEAAEEVEEPLTTDENGRFHIDAKTTLSNLIKQCPEIVDHLISLNPKFEKLKLLW